MKQVVVLLVTAATATVMGQSLPPSCSRPVYCDSELLHRVQIARIFNDSKTFVDLPMRQDENATLAAFDELLNRTDNNPTDEQLSAFVDEYFDDNAAADELESWNPSDYSDEPEFLKKIRDELLREFAKDIHQIWPTLGRKVNSTVFEKPGLYSLLPVSNGFIIPGGRFKELYYWDAYWIIEGLLISGMDATAKGMIENLLELLKKFGHIPNGSRCYYEQRSQPPLLTEMIMLYYNKTKDEVFLAEHIEAIEMEMDYWLTTQTVNVEKDGKKLTLLQYNAPSTGPRPESYYEDFTDAQTMDNSSDHTEFYIDIKSAAESGWDFSTRWFVSPQGDNSGNLTNINTRYIVPVDLNAIFAKALQNTAAFHDILNNTKKADGWKTLANQWETNIEEVLWHEEDGIWYDFNMQNQKHRQYFYPSNMAPLWQRVVSDENVKKHAPRVLQYLAKSQGLDFPGGIPVSLERSGQQWDYPNVWPPQMSVFVKGLAAMKDEAGDRLAVHLAQEWVRICYKGYKESKIMYEKYDAEVPGQFGGGGEYTVQAGFGWTNGVVLEFLDRYGDCMTSSDPYDTDQEPLIQREPVAPTLPPAENKASNFGKLSMVPLVLGGNYMARA